MKSKKKIFSSVLISSFFLLPYSSFANNIASGQLNCEYSSKFERCIVANKNGTTRSIKDFICLQSQDREAILDQIIIDVNFREIDEEIYEYLDRLSGDVEHVVQDPHRAMDDVTKNLAKEKYYYKKYRDLCHGDLLQERLKCTGSIPNTSTSTKLESFSFDGNICMALVEYKLDIYTKVADGILKHNKSEYLSDAHKKYVQQERTRYSELQDDQMFIIGSMGRLARGVTHWTPNPLQAVIFRILEQYI